MKTLAKKGLIVLCVVLSLSALLSNTVLYVMTAKCQFIKPISMVIDRSINTTGKIMWQNTVDVYYYPAEKYNVYLEQVDIVPGQAVFENDVIASAKLDAAYADEMNSYSNELEALQNELIRIDKKLSDASINLSAKNITSGIQLFDLNSRIFALRMALYIRAIDIGIQRPENEEEWSDIVVKSANEELRNIYHELSAAEAERSEIDSNKVLKQIPQNALDLILQRNSIEHQLERIGNEIIDLTVLGHNLSALRAPGNGVVVQVFAKSRQKYDGTSAFYIYSEDAHPQIIVQCNPTDEISIGTACAINIANQAYAGEVAAIRKADEENQNVLEAAIEITDDQLYEQADDPNHLIGKSVDVEILNEMGYFESVIPLTAIVTEEGKNYLYVISAKESIWGEEYTIKKTEVQIAAKNTQYAAIYFSTRPGEWIANLWDRTIVDGGRIMRAQT